MIEKAYDLNRGLEICCYGGNKEIAKIIIIFI